MNAYAGAQSLRPVEVEELPIYPISAETRLNSHWFIAFNHGEYQGSEFRNLATADVRGVALDLLCAAQDQTPIGTLPVNEQILAKLVKESLDVWRELAAKPVSPLYEWRRCRCDTGEIRLYNPRLLKVTLEAVSGRSKHLEGLEADRERKRLGDLPGKILRAGGSERMAQDTAYVMQLDQFLLDNFAGRSRTAKVMRAAMDGFELHRCGL